MQMKISQEKMLAEKTLLDNAFVMNYMPYAPENYVKIYITGLWAATFGTAQTEPTQFISDKLSIEPAIVDEAFRYWETQGVVNIIKTDPPQIEFLPVGKSLPSMQKFSKTKYKDFNNQLHAMLPNRNILPSEYNEYYSLMEDSHLEPNAMLAIIAYCIRQKGETISYPYILAVARNIAGQGLLTFDRVNEQLSEFDLYEKDIKPILAALGSKKKPDHEDKRLFIKWTKQMEFTQSTVIKVAKTIKKGGMEKLDALLSKYYERHLMSIEEINGYNENKEKLTALAKNVNRIIGVYYEQLDFIIETYILRWLEYGFDENTVIKVATYCFEHNVRTLPGMNETVEKFYKQGLISSESIEHFINRSIETDVYIKNVFTVAGISRNITSRDRDCFKIWQETWGMPECLIELAAKKSAGNSNPIAYMNATLSSWFKAGITTTEQAENYRFTQQTPKNDNKITKTYTSEQLNAMFDNLDYEDL